MSKDKQHRTITYDPEPNISLPQIQTHINASHIILTSDQWQP